MTVNLTDASLMQREITPAGGSYATITQCTNIKPPKWERKSTEVYIHDQSAPVVKLGALNAMEASFDAAFDPGNSYHTQLLTDLSAKTERSYQIVLSDTGGYQIRFNAVVNAIEFDDLDAEGNPLKISVTLKLSAEPVVTP